MRFRRLLPEPGAGEAHELLAEVRPGERAPADRPLVLLNMVVTADGAVTVGGRSAPIGGPGDRRMFAELRAIADAVLVGTNTLRAERYGRLVKDPERRARRAAAGLAPDPAAVLFCRGLDLPWESPLFAEPTQPVYIACDAAAAARQEIPAVAAPVTLLALEEPTIGAALRALRAEHGIRSVLCEGGPVLNGHLLAAGALDELFLTIGPLLGGEPAAARLLAGDAPPLPAPLRLRLLWLLCHEDELFLRYGAAAC